MSTEQSSLNDLILEEIRELRTLTTSSFQSQGERIAKLETALKPLLPNGSPGIIKELQNDVASLKSSRTWTAGVAAAISAVVGAIGWVIKLLL